MSSSARRRGFRRSFGTILLDNRFARFQSSKYTTAKKVAIRKDLPENFNPVEVWGAFLSPVQNQGDCGACWAVSSAKCLTDRYSILTVGAFSEILSPYQMVMCEGTIFPSIPLDKDSTYQINLEAHTAGACNGNTLFTAMDYLYSIGCVSEVCVSKGLFKKYNIPDLPTIVDAEHVPLCQTAIGDNYDKCLDRKKAPKFYRSIVGYQIDNDIQLIKQEIYKWGPVVSGFKVFDDFLNKYDGKTIYMGPKPGEKDNGGHAIEIVGWGKENGIDYWWICNSWGPRWGLGGYFKMKMNIAECELEKNVVAFIPDFPTFSLKMVDYPISTSPDLIALRKWMDINPIYGYKESTIREIKEGKIKGDLRKIFSTKIPDMNTKWLGEINKHDADLYYTVPHFVIIDQGEEKIKFSKVVLFIFLFIVSYFIGKYMASLMRGRKRK